MTEAAVTFLVEHAKEVVKEYKDLISGSAEDEFHRLTKELGLVKDFLRGAAATTMQERDLLEKMFEEVVHQVEDSIDTCLTKAMMSSRKPETRGYSLGLVKEVKNAREELLHIFNYAKMKFSALQIADGSGEDPIPKLKRCMPMNRKRVVDVDDMESNISGQLMNETKELDIISIIGMPGHGKTTLTTKIFEKQSICYYFPTRIWVYISQDFSKRDMLFQILKQLSTTVRDMSNLDDYRLAQTVRSRLEKERFLLVLDDVWSVHVWNEIKQALPLSNGKSKVLITSREWHVGKESSNNRPPFALRFLTARESWELLQFEVFGNLEACPYELREIGFHIADQCYGMAQTIAVVGGILLDQLARGVDVALKEWKMTADNISDFPHRDERWMLQINVIELSYSRLPDYLRECFLYLGVFPEEYEIPVKTLSSLWIAEGFIQPEDERSLEESAELNMNDLISKNLLTVVKTNHIGKVITCRVHDIIHAFCISKSYEYNLFKEMKQSDIKEICYPPVSKLHKYLRLICNFHLSDFLSQSPHGPRLRSFFCFYQQKKEVKPEYISSMLDCFPLLRVLEFRSIKLDQYPSKFMKLIHLRYLTLCAENLTVLPEALSQLWNLQTLVAETGSHSITMKANIWKMIQLRHLNTNVAVILQDTDRDGQAGQNLHTLSKLSHESCTESVSRKAQKLKTLGIYGKLANVLRTNFLENLLHLENLKLVQGLIYEAASEDLLHGLPRHNCFPPSLRKLTLANTFLSWQHVPALATIKSLEALKLKDNAFVGLSWKVDAYEFPKLQLLLVVNTDLLLWEASPDSFPSLRYLVVKNCEKLKEIPESLGTNLEKLEIERLCKSAVESAKRIKTVRGNVAGEFNLKMGPGCETE